MFSPSVVESVSALEEELNSSQEQDDRSTATDVVPVDTQTLPEFFYDGSRALQDADTQSLPVEQLEDILPSKLLQKKTIQSRGGRKIKRFQIY